MTLCPRRERLPLWGGELLGLWGVDENFKRQRCSLFGAHLSLPATHLVAGPALTMALPVTRRDLHGSRQGTQRRGTFTTFRS